MASNVTAVNEIEVNIKEAVIDMLSHSLPYFVEDDAKKLVEQELEECLSELMELKNGEFCVTENEGMENCVQDNDSSIKDMEVSTAENNLCLESVTSHSRKVSQENVERERHSLQPSTNDSAESLQKSGQGLKWLEDLKDKLAELNKYSSVVYNHVTQLNSASVQQEKDLTLKRAQRLLDLLPQHFSRVTSESGAFRSENEEVKKMAIKLQKGQEISMVKHTEEWQFIEERIRNLESEILELILKKTAEESLFGKLMKKSEQLSETFSLSETEVQDLLLKLSLPDSKNGDVKDQLLMNVQDKSEEKEALKQKLMWNKKILSSVREQVNLLQNNLEEKERLHLQYKEREKELEKKAVAVELLTASESTLSEANNNYKLMLERIQIGLAKILKEISQTSNQVILMEGLVRRLTTKETYELQQIWSQAKSIENLGYASAELNVLEAQIAMESKIIGEVWSLLFCIIVHYSDLMELHFTIPDLKYVWVSLMLSAKAVVNFMAFMNVLQIASSTPWPEIVFKILELGSGILGFLEPLIASILVPLPELVNDVSFYCSRASLAIDCLHLFYMYLRYFFALRKIFWFLHTEPKDYHKRKRGEP